MKRRARNKFSKNEVSEILHLKDRYGDVGFMAGQTIYANDEEENRNASRVEKGLTVSGTVLILEDRVG